MIFQVPSNRGYGREGDESQKLKAKMDLARTWAGQGRGQVLLRRPAGKCLLAKGGRRGGGEVGRVGPDVTSWGENVNSWVWDLIFWILSPRFFLFFLVWTRDPSPSPFPREHTRSQLPSIEVMALKIFLGRSGSEALESSPLKGCNCPPTS